MTAYWCKFGNYTKTYFENNNYHLVVPPFFTKEPHIKLGETPCHRLGQKFSKHGKMRLGDFALSVFRVPGVYPSGRIPRLEEARVVSGDCGGQATSSSGA